MFLAKICTSRARLIVACICWAAVDGYSAADERFQSNLMSNFTCEARDVALDVETPAEAYADRPVVLHVTLRNKTLYDVSWVKTTVEQDLSIRVRDDSGRLVPLTPLGRSALGFYDPAANAIYGGMPAGSVTEGRMHSRQSTQWDLVLSDFFILHPGSYHIELRKSMQIEDNLNGGFQIEIRDLRFWVLKG